MSRLARASLTVLILVTIIEAASLIRRGSRGDTDFGVFYRTSQLVKAGVAGDLYRRTDAVNGWPVVVSPLGLVILQPFSSFGLVGASVVWAAFNLLLVGGSIYALRDLVKHSGSRTLERRFPWIVAAFLVLAAGSIQVGQFSVLFVTCWLLSLRAAAVRHYGWAGFWLAIPTAIKVYPLIMLAPLVSIARTAKAAARDVLLFLLALVFVAVFIPTIVLGPRAWEMNRSFLENVILNRAQVRYQQSLRTPANQSLDTVLLRYLTHDQDFHERHEGVLHLRFDRDHVLAMAAVLRAAIFLTTLAGVWRWRRGRASFHSGDLLVMVALWSAALYMMMPETKSRYAVYTTIAFLPLIEAAAGRVVALAVAAGVLLVAVVLPVPLQVYAVGFLGPLFLWLANLWLAASRDVRHLAPSAPTFELLSGNSEKRRSL